mmetsp:Transcript_126200/g.403915  ORF Transcript_126200/g.403915 Transcript_126200/m.403915 type:complete len:230 (-) Transcript_126200:1462-2151(-)
MTFACEHIWIPAINEFSFRQACSTLWRGRQRLAGLNSQQALIGEGPLPDMAIQEPGQPVRLGKEALPLLSPGASGIGGRIKCKGARRAEGLHGEACTLPRGKRLVLESRILHGEQLGALCVDCREQLCLALALDEVRRIPCSLLQHAQQRGDRSVQRVLAIRTGGHGRLLNDLHVPLCGGSVQTTQDPGSCIRGLRAGQGKAAEESHGHIFLEHGQHGVLHIALVHRLA